MRNDLASICRLSSHAAMIVGVLCGAGCGKSEPKEVVIQPAPFVLSEEPHNPDKVVVGDPTAVPGNHDGPCEKEDCGHPKCIAARKFIADAHRCEVCEQPIVWGDAIVAYFNDGRSSNVADESKGVKLIVHQACNPKMVCAGCKRPLSSGAEPFHREGTGWLHDGCMPPDDASKQQSSTE